MDPQVAPLAELFDLDADLLLDCLEGLPEAEARRCQPAEAEPGPPPETLRGFVSAGTADSLRTSH